MAKLKAEALKAIYLQRLSNENVAQDALAYQQRERDRQKTLPADGISSRAQLDRAVDEVNAQRAAAQAAGHSLDLARSSFHAGI
jgi:hypothetical protein